MKIWRLLVYPACAGIDLEQDCGEKRRIRLPRMRGDRPPCAALPSRAVRFTPHARGSTEYGIGFGAIRQVYPACAGIDPLEDRKLNSRERLPRMRGDRPTKIFS